MAKWSQEEIELLILNHARFGTQWQRIALEMVETGKNRRDCAGMHQRLVLREERLATRLAAAQKVLKPKRRKIDIQTIYKNLPKITGVPYAIMGELEIDKAEVGIGQEPVEYAYDL